MAVAVTDVTGSLWKTRRTTYMGQHSQAVRDS
jgi:hypothetical protein